MFSLIRAKKYLSNFEAAKQPGMPPERNAGADTGVQGAKPPVGCRGEAPEEEKTERVQGGSPGRDKGRSSCRVQGRSPWWVQKGKALDYLIIA